MSNPIDIIDSMENHAETTREMSMDLNSLIAFVSTTLPDEVDPNMETSHAMGFNSVTLTVTATLPELTGAESRLLEDDRWDEASVEKRRGAKGYVLCLEANIRRPDYHQ